MYDKTDKPGLMSNFSAKPTYYVQTHIITHHFFFPKSLEITARLSAQTVLEQAEFGRK